MAELRVPLGDTIRGVEDVRPLLVIELDHAQQAKALLDQRYQADAATAQQRIDALTDQLAEVDRFIAWKDSQ